MDIVRRNTDYALRAMVHLAAHEGGEPIATSVIAKEELIPYQLACKLLQKLQKAKLVESTMGPQGGFNLAKGACAISLQEIIETIQGPIVLNRCLIGRKFCPRRTDCMIGPKLASLQEHIDNSLSEITLSDLVQGGDKAKRKAGKGTK